MRRFKQIFMLELESYGLDTLYLGECVRRAEGLRCTIDSVARYFCFRGCSNAMDGN